MCRKVSALSYYYYYYFKSNNNNKGGGGTGGTGLNALYPCVRVRVYACVYAYTHVRVVLL